MDDTLAGLVTLGEDHVSISSAAGRRSAALGKLLLTPTTDFDRRVVCVRSVLVGANVTIQNASSTIMQLSFAPEVSAEEQQRIQVEAARKQSFAKTREESSRLACERDVARAKQRGSRVFPIAATEALCARLVTREFSNMYVPELR